MATLATKNLRTEQEDALASYLRQISRTERLTREGEVELARHIQRGDHQALQRLVEANLRFVVKVANKYKGCGIFLLDLINEGNIGLMQAAEKFDPDRGVRFITYAVWWIEQAIRQAMAGQCGIVRLPLNRARILYQITKKGNELTQRMGAEPTPDDLARHLEMPLDEIEDILRVSRQRFSLESPLAEGTSTRYLDMLEAANLPSHDQNLLRDSLRQEIADLLDKLGDKERTIIALRFGLDGAEPLTLEEVGKKLRLSRERIRQIESRAKARLLRWASARRLNSYLN